jgi:copper chaperone
MTAHETTHTIVGMTCDHCARSVAEEVEAVDGVIAADVELASGRLVVTGNHVDESAVAAAVEEAGYEVAR